MTRLPARAASVFTAVFGAFVLASCFDAPERLSGPLDPIQRANLAELKKKGIRDAIDAQERHKDKLHKIKGVLGTAVGLLPDGRAAVQVLVLDATTQGVPAQVDSIPVVVKVTGMIMARSDPTLRLRPALPGYSVGHPAITAGTIGARVIDAGGVYALSNNHVLANSNGASIGDPMLQPGTFDGGTAADQIGTLVAFKPIDFAGGNNTMDAAIAVSDAVNLGNATPADDGYGLPNGKIFGDANDDRVFDDRNDLLGLQVQKYGRTTKLTHGTITGINAQVDVCYEVVFIFCVKLAHYVDQVIITPGAFSDGGDSGSLIVTDDDAKNPVALLFAGGAGETIGNRIDLVLNHFNVSIDGSNAPPPPPPPPPDPVTDIAVFSITAPSSVTQGTTATVTVVLKNVGNQPVGTFSVSLDDHTDGVAIGTKFVAALNPGAIWTHNHSWTPTTSSSIGPHSLVASSALIDDNAANNTASTTTQVVEFVPPPPVVDVHVGNLSGTAQRNGNTWSATVEITVHDADHAPLNGATVTGNWSRTGLYSNTCTTGELGGNGTCIVLFPSIPRNITSVIFAVSNVTYPERTYSQIKNHDPDGSSNGTGQKVLRP